MNRTPWPPPYGKRPHPLPAPYRHGVQPGQWSNNPGVVGAVWRPASELAPPPRLVEWSRRRHKPVWAWGLRMKVMTTLALVAAGSAVGLMVLG